MLVAFDFDGTLSDSEMTVLLGERRGVADEMAAITERAMNDEIPYAESLRERVALLSGLSLDERDAAFEGVVLRPGAAELIADLRSAGHEAAILTGGFEAGVEAALSRAGVAVDAVLANRLILDGGSLAGEVEGPLIEGTKDDALADLATEMGIDSAETIAVGDGANDVPMLAAAGLAVGFRPKPAVEPSADVVVDSMAALREAFVERGLL